MRKLLHILPLLLALALPSCEIPFALNQEGEPRIYMQCIADDTGIFLSPRYAAPVGASRASLEHLQIDLTVNGESVGVKSWNGEVYFADVKLQAGDRIDVSLQADGVAPVSGSSSVPSAPVVEDVQVVNIQVDTVLATQISLQLDHAPGEEEYFGIQIIASTEIQYADGEPDQVLTYLTPGYILTLGESIGFDLGDFVQVNYNGAMLGGQVRSPLTLVTRKQFSGNVYSFYLNSFDNLIMDTIRDRMPGGNTGVAGGGIASGEVGDGASAGTGSGSGAGSGTGTDTGTGTGSGTGSGTGTGDQPVNPGRIPIGTETRYYVFFSSLSPEFYFYAKALYQSNFDFLSNMGLTPANFTWSNVSGGLGFVGAKATYALPAIEISEEN